MGRFAGRHGQNAFVELFEGVATQSGIGEFFECSEGDGALPVGHVAEVVDFEADFRLPAHHLHFEALVGMAVDVFSVVDVADGNDIDVVAFAAGQPAYHFFFKEFVCFRDAQVSNHNISILSSQR